MIKHIIERTSSSLQYIIKAVDLSNCCTADYDGHSDAAGPPFLLEHLIILYPPKRNNVYEIVFLGEAK